MAASPGYTALLKGLLGRVAKWVMGLMFLGEEGWQIYVAVIDTQSNAKRYSRYRSLIISGS